MALSLIIPDLAVLSDSPENSEPKSTIWSSNLNSIQERQQHALAKGTQICHYLATGKTSGIKTQSNYPQKLLFSFWGAGSNLE